MPTVLRADCLPAEYAQLLDADAQRRLHANPLRILDTKNPAMQDAWSMPPPIA